MKPNTKRRPWIRLISAAFSVTAIALLAGTSTGRLQVYRVLFTLGSDDVQAWAAERMSEEAAEAALPVIFELLSDPDFGFPREPDRWGPLVLDLDPQQENPLARAARALMPKKELPAAPPVLAPLIRATRHPRPELRVFAFLLLAEQVRGAPPERRAELQEARDCLKRVVCEDPDPLVRWRSFDAVNWRHQSEGDVIAACLEAETELRNRSQIFEKIIAWFKPNKNDRFQPAHRDRILVSLLRFWSEKLDAARKGSGEPVLNIRIYDELLRRYSEASRLAILEWIRAHPEDSQFFKELYWFDVGPHSAKVYDKARLVLEETRHPDLADQIARYLEGSEGFDPRELWPLAREHLAEEKRGPLGAVLLDRVLTSDDLGPQLRAEIGPVLARALANPALRERLTTRLVHPLFLERPEAETLLERLAESPRQVLRFTARCALRSFPQNPRAASLLEILEALGAEDPRRERAWRTLRSLPPSARPALLEALGQARSIDLSHSLLRPLLVKAIGQAQLEQAAQKPGLLGERARTLLGK